MLSYLFLNDKICSCLSEQFLYPLICTSGRVELLYSLAIAGVYGWFDKKITPVFSAKPYRVTLLYQFHFFIVVLTGHSAANGLCLLHIRKPHIQVILILSGFGKIHIIYIWNQFQIVQIRWNESRIHYVITGACKLEPETLRAASEALPVRKH